MKLYIRVGHPVGRGEGLGVGFGVGFGVGLGVGHPDLQLFKVAKKCNKLELIARNKKINFYIPVGRGVGFGVGLAIIMIYYMYT